MLCLVLFIVLCGNHAAFAENEYEADLSEDVELEDYLISEQDLGTVSYGSLF